MLQTQTNKIIFRSTKIPFNTGTLSLDSWYCKLFELRAALPYTQVPFMRVFNLYKIIKATSKIKAVSLGLY
jgi:hypothetical protein